MAARYDSRVGPHATPVRLVATDLDGTLLSPGGRVTARAAAAVAAARSLGIHVVPVTGRPPKSVWPIATAAGLGPLGVCSNGAVIVDLERHRVLETESIAGEVATRLVDLLRDAVPGVSLATEHQERFFFETGFFEVPVDWQEELHEVSDIRPVVTEGCTKLVVRHPDPAVDAPALTARLEQAVGEEGNVTTSGLDWVEIGAPRVTKAYALERVCGRLGVHLSQVVAVGDNHNDLTVLGWAGQAMAPSNAIPEVLALVDRVLPSNGEHGVAQLLEQLVAATVLQRSRRHMAGRYQGETCQLDLSESVTSDFVQQKSSWQVSPL